MDATNPHARDANSRPREDATTRPLPLSALGLCAGVAIADAAGLVGELASPAEWRGFVAVLVVAGAISWLALARRAARAARALVVGAFAICGAARIVALEPPIDDASGFARVSGVVARGHLDLPDSMRAGAVSPHLLLESVEIDTGAGPRAIPGRLRLEAKDLDRFVPRGSIVEASARLRAPREARNPGDAGEARRFALSGVVAAAVVEHQSALHVRSGTSLVARVLAANDRLRRTLTHGLATALEPNAAALAAALVLGVRDGLDPRFVSAVASAGTIHLLAISGMQVSWLVVLVRGILGLWLRPTLANVFVVGFALGYADLAGAEAPVLRAGLAAALVGIGRFLGRPARALDALAAAAIVLVLDEPGEVFRPGFQLSFVACWALLTRGPEFPPKGSFPRRVAFSIRQSLRWSVRATIATAPIVAYHFGTIAPLSPLLTLVLTPPFLAAFLASVMLAPASIVLPDSALGLVAVPAEASLHFAAWAFEFTARLPFASFSCLPLDAAAALVLIAGLEIARRAELGRYLRGAALAATIALSGAIEFARSRPPAETRVVVLDVGHGQAVIVRATGGANLLFDCGAAGADSRRDGERAARTTLLACRELGVRSFTVAFLSHGDADHRNGLEHLLARGFVERLVVPPHLDPRASRPLLATASTSGVAIDEAARGFEWIDVARTLHVRVLAPELGIVDGSANDRSMVAIVEALPRVPQSATRNRPTTVIAEAAPLASLLLPGDLETPGITRLLALEPNLTADVVLLPHHGRDEAGLAPFVFRVDAPLWIASRGRLHGVTLAERLAERHDARLRVTADHGAIEIRIGGDGTIVARGFHDPDGYDR